MDLAEYGIQALNTGVLIGVFFRLGSLITAINTLGGRVDKLEKERESHGMVRVFN